MEQIHQTCLFFDKWRTGKSFFKPIFYGTGRTWARCFTICIYCKSQKDSSLVPLFFCANGDIEDYIVIDGWKLSFSAPTTSMYRCHSTSVYMEKDSLSIDVKISSPWNIAKEFPCIWKLFYIVKDCTSQIEVDYAKKFFENELEIENLKSKNLLAEAEIESLNMLITSYKQLLEKISNLADSKKE